MTSHDEMDAMFEAVTKRLRAGGCVSDMDRLRKKLAEKEKVIAGLADALTIILPLAKGYAIEHPVGNNAGMVETAQAALAAAGRGRESEPYDPVGHSGMYP